MFIAHIPAGYLVTRLALLRSSSCRGRNVKVLFGSGLLASVLPDIDMLYFYLIDHRRHLHHSYWTHIPFWWLVILATAMIGGITLRSARCRQTVQVIALNVFIHLLLDSVAGKIRWLAPFYRAGFGLVDVPSRYGWWVWNYFLHWTFGFEIVLAGIALYVYIADRGRDRLQLWQVVSTPPFNPGRSLGPE